MQASIGNFSRKRARRIGAGCLVRSIRIRTTLSTHDGKDSGFPFGFDRTLRMHRGATPTKSFASRPSMIGNWPSNVAVGSYKFLTSIRPLESHKVAFGRFLLFIGITSEA